MFADSDSDVSLDGPDFEREKAARVLRKLPAPSSYSNPRGDSGWSKKSTFAGVLQCHRTSHSPLLHNTPITLLDPILAQLAFDCESLIPTRADTAFSVKVAKQMCQAFSDEESRVQKIWHLLAEEFGIGLTRIEFGSSKTDGSILGSGGHGLVFNIEVKNEVGEGHGAIHVQNAAYAAQFAARPQSRLIR